ncbi:MAG: hypothetical protein J6K16_03450 [Alphaproteobacteria bacterium]|nr:hypothetical protein [Alphaproteobacteria bacterium]
MSVFKSFEQQISEIQSNEDCENIIGNICSSVILRNTELINLLEKVVSSPKFEKPSSKLCKIFYKTLTELHSDSTLGLIEKFSQKNGYEYSREFVNCVSRNVWPGKKTTEALRILEKTIANSTGNKEAYYEILDYAKDIIRDGADEDNRIDEQTQLIGKMLRAVPSRVIEETDAEVYTDAIVAFAGISDMNNNEHIHILFSHLDFAAKNIKNSIDCGDNISDVCANILKANNITPDIRRKTLDILNVAALNGNFISGDMFKSDHNERSIQIYIDEISKIDKQLKQKNISDEFCCYALLLAKEFSEEPRVDKNILFSLVQSVQKNKTRVIPDFNSLCMDFVVHDEFRDKAVELFHNEIPLLIKKVAHNRDIIGDVLDFYEMLPDDYPNEKIIPDILLLAQNTSNNFCPLLIKRGYFQQAFECIKGNIANFGKIKEPKTQLLHTYWESVLDIVEHVATQPDNEDMMKQIVSDIKKLAHHHCKMNDTGTIPPYQIDRILATILKDCPQLSDECIKIWKIYVSVLPEKCKYSSMLNCLEQITIKSKVQPERILKMFEMLPQKMDCDGQIAALKFLNEFASHFSEQADKSVALAKDKKVLPEFWLNDEKYCNNRWNYREIRIGLDAYKSFLLSVGDKMPNVFVELQLAETVKKYFNKWDARYRYATDNHLLWKKKYSDIEKEYRSLTSEEKIHINRILSSQKLSLDEKMTLLTNGAGFCKDFNIGVYLNIKKYIFEKEEDANTQWVIPSAIACAKIYGKEYMNYFRTIENYNEQIPKRQDEFWKKSNEYDDKKEELEFMYLATDFILKSLENLPDSALLARVALKKNLFLYEIDSHIKKYINEWKNNVLSSSSFDIKRERRRLAAKRNGLLGTIYATSNYISDEQFKPIGFERATSWMVKAINTKADFERIRKFADKNIKAKNIVGQPFLRVNAPHLEEKRLRSLNDIERTDLEFSDDFSLIIPRLKYLTDKELSSMKYSEVYERLSKINFDYTCREFAIENSAYVDSQETYDEAEVIYYKGMITPSRFADKPVLYSSDKNFRCLVAKKDDVRILFVGEKTSCCQSYGDVGGPCAVDSVINPNSGCLIFESRKNEDEPWKIVACSWFYASQNGNFKGLTFDNVEVDTHEHCEEQVETLFLGMVEEFSKDNYKYITVGNSGNDIYLEGQIISSTNPLPDGYEGYTDAEVQRIIKNNPNANQETIERIVIKAGDDEDLRAFSLFSSKDEIDWLKGDRCIVLKDEEKVYAIAIWNKNKTNAELITDKGCSADKLKEFRSYALDCISNDIKNPQINEVENDIPTDKIKLPLSRPDRESR